MFSSFRKTLSLSLLIALVVLSFTSPSFGQESKVSPGAVIAEKIKNPEIQWKIPEIGKEVEKVQLTNGLTLYLMEDHELPLISIEALIKAGDVYVPIEKKGTSEIFSQAWRTGGTRTMSGEEIDRQLEYLGALLAASLGMEAGSAKINLLAKDLEIGLTIFSEILMHPDFAEKEIVLAKEQLKERLRRQNDQPNAILLREFYHTLYGAHPYGRVLEWEPVSKITRQDLLDYHDKYFVPNNTSIGIVGDFQKRDMIEKVTKKFTSWSLKNVSFPKYLDLFPEFERKTILVNKDVNQSYIRMGHFGVMRGNPDAYAIELMNFILGGDDLTSRMGAKIRSEKGLAYSISSFYNTDARDYGTFSVSSQTKTESTMQIIKVIEQELEKISSTLISNQELSAAKESFMNEFVFRFTSPQAVVSQLMELDYKGYPKDYLKHYLENIKSVTREDILKVAKNYLKPDKMILMIVGNKKDLGNQLELMGPVVVKDLKAPALN
ncbi:MAG: insulinase family protein [Candidatus Tectomicrobia bacterium]|uniref:Insulinase family protein n=1 Tax=Tectimicrobiota bacterium TaxID=2528274 RepID=A0A933GLB0_UNCTE|nr:insulinase family protein [Candidatus Tectomicrobia bacterium]